MLTICGVCARFEVLCTKRFKIYWYPYSFLKRYSRFIVMLYVYGCGVKGICILNCYFDVTLVVRAYSNFHLLMDLFDQESLDIHVLLLEVTKMTLIFLSP